MKPRHRFRRFDAPRAEPATVVPATGDTKGPRQVIEQAARDISRGLRDTDLHGTPSNVPGPGASPEQSPGAEVPPEGVNVDK